MRRKSAALAIVLALAPSIAIAKCDLAVKDIKARLADGVSMEAVSPRAFYFLQGIWATSPITPPGLPPNASRAFLLRKAHATSGDVVFVDGPSDTSCIIGPMLPAPKALLDLVSQVDNGPGSPL